MKLRTSHPSLINDGICWFITLGILTALLSLYYFLFFSKSTDRACLAYHPLSSLDVKES